MIEPNVSFFSTPILNQSVNCPEIKSFWISFFAQFLGRFFSEAPVYKGNICSVNLKTKICGNNSNKSQIAVQFFFRKWSYWFQKISYQHILAVEIHFKNESEPATLKENNLPSMHLNSKLTIMI